MLEVQAAKRKLFIGEQGEPMMKLYDELCNYNMYSFTIANFDHTSVH